MSSIFSKMHRSAPQNQAMTESFWSNFSIRSNSGQSVTANNALQVSAVFDCLRILGEGVAQVPFRVMKSRNGGGGSDMATTHPAFRIISKRPNSWQTSFEFRENLVFQAGLLGNFYCFKNMTANGRLVSLVPFPPGSVSVRRDPKTKKLIYQVSVSAVSESGLEQISETKDFPQEAIWHVRGPSWDTFTGMEALKLAREAIGLSMAAEEAHALLHANGGQTSGIYSINDALEPAGYKSMRSWVEKQITGANRFRPFVMDRGGKFTPTAMTGVDAQHIETRRFQIEEICRRFRVMPIMLGAGEKMQGYASSEQMFQAHVVHTLSPWYSRIEMSAEVNLLSIKEQEAGYYFKFFPNGLMRGAIKDRAEYLDKMYRMKAMNPNEIRALDDLNPYDGGEQYYVEQGMQDTTGVTP